MAMNNEPESTETRESLAFDATVATRKSVRAFRSEPVPRDLLAHVFTLANCAPSNCNTQPWYTVVASGNARERLRQRYIGAASERRFALDFPYDGKYEGVYRERQHDSAARLYTAMRIPREDKAGRVAATMRNFELFDAPHAAFIFMPEWCGIREAADVGMYAQTLMLALVAHGLASCPQTSLSYAAPLVREELGVDASYRLLFGMSFGYEDTAQAVNQFRVPRAEIAANTRFVD